MSGNSALDRWDAGDSRCARREAGGLRLFFGRAACNQCHLGPNLTDSRFHNLGVGWRRRRRSGAGAWRLRRQGPDEVTGDEAADTGAFKTPTLREVSRRAPYMHDGSVATLRGGGAQLPARRDSEPLAVPA